jgi:flavin reductase (DIM6/NTAB) family NADH-FMN oxidoreductase RutF
VGVLPEQFRAALGQWPSGVSVVTSRAGGVPVGMTVSAFFSVSVTPPLVAVCLDKESATLEAISINRRFAVNVLSAEQSALSDRFALAPELTRFDAVTLLDTPGATSPLLAGAIVNLDCEVDATHGAGDHVLCVGRVLLALAHGGEPLLFHASRYYRLAPL